MEYGSQVKVHSHAPNRFRPGEVGSVFSIFEVNSKPHAEQSGIAIGEIAIGVEFENGSGLEVPPVYLRVL